jgi:hypothetical protein
VKYGANEMEDHMNIRNVSADELETMVIGEKTRINGDHRNLYGYEFSRRTRRIGWWICMHCLAEFAGDGR